jgi:hypothetical protein
MARYDQDYRNRPYRGAGRNPDPSWATERGRDPADASRWSGMWRRGFGYDTGHGDEHRGVHRGGAGYGGEYRGFEGGRGDFGGEFGGEFGDREPRFPRPIRGRSGGYAGEFGRGRSGGYAGDFGRGRSGGYAGEFGRGRFLRDAGYDDEFRTVGLGYGEEYKSRWQTEQGDPFGDRDRHTPIRMMRGEWGEYDDDYGRSWRERGYGREFRPRRDR